MEEFDWEHLFDGIPLLDSEPALSGDFPKDISPEEEDVLFPSLSIGDMEQFLMADDEGHFPDLNPIIQQAQDEEDFLSYLLPLSSDSPSAEVIDEPPPQPQTTPPPSPPRAQDVTPPPSLTPHSDSPSQDDDDDSVTKKRKRQMRNRDAAVRSRERKKMYVKDLELKSRYFESECKRLSMMFHCCLAENQSLRAENQSLRLLSLNQNNGKAVGASVTGQESAVLLLESLLLGSLLWFLGIISLLLTLSGQLLSVQEAATLENLDEGNRRSLGSRKMGSRRMSLRSFMMGKRCKSSRSRMKPVLEAAAVICRVL